MKNYWILRVIGAIVLLVGIALVAYFAYNAGLAQGSTTVPAAQFVAPWHGRGEWFPLGGLLLLPFLLCLVPFFLCLFIFMPLRMIFGPHRMHMHMHGRWYGGEGEVPPPIEELHRRMHEKQDKAG